MTFLYTYRWEFALASLSLLAHTILFLAVIRVNDGSIVAAVRADDGYFEIANNLLAGNGFSMEAKPPYLPNALRTPGYIYFLAALIGTVGVAGAAIVQLLLSACIPILGMRIARHITDSHRIGRAAGMILALDPTLALLSYQFYTDTFFIVLFFAWMLLIFRYLEEPRWTMLVASSLTLGLAILTRPTAQYIPLLIVPFILWRCGAHRWRLGAAHAFVSLAIVGALLAPWIIRNYNEFGAPGVSSQKAYVIYNNFAPAVLSIARGTDFATEFTTFSTYAERNSNVITPANGDAYMARALDVARTYPLASAYVVGKSLFTFFTNDGMYTLLAAVGYAPRDFTVLLVLARLIWLAITLAALVGASVYFFAQRSPRTILILLLVAYFALTSTIAAFGTNPRYRLPVDPIILALAGVGGIYLLEKARRFRNTA